MLGDKSLAVIADSASLPRRELEEAIALGKQFQFAVRVIHTREFDNPNYTANPGNRCYFCKHELFASLGPIAKAGGFAVLAYGENASDVGDYRPGMQAAREFEVRAPLKEVGLTKDEIRELSAQLGLPTADKPQMACLSSRVPHGEPVTPEKLRMIEEAENVLRDLGFYDVRVRHHELPNPDSGVPAGQGVGGRFDVRTALGKGRPVMPGRHLARIQVGAAELPKFLANGNSAKVVEALKRVGYAHVTVDLEGYQRGNFPRPPVIN